MNITQETYNRYLSYANRFTSGNKAEAEDLLNDVLLKIIEKQLPPEKINDSHVFIIIKHHFLNNKEKEKVRKNISYHSLEFLEDIYEYDGIEIELESIIKKDELFQYKLDLINKVVKRLSSYEKKIYKLYYIKGIPMKKISQETGISMMHIFDKIHKIKDKIKQQYNKMKDIKELNGKTYYKEENIWYGLHKNNKPIKIVGEKLLKKLNTEPIEGLGDVIANITSVLGIEKCSKCEERRKKLNNIFPWTRGDIRELTEEELLLMERINSHYVIQNNDVNALFALYNSLFGLKSKRCNCGGLIKRMIQRINDVIANQIKPDNQIENE